MGAYLSQPNTVKSSGDGAGLGPRPLHFGFSAMQGWRVSMEVSRAPGAGPGAEWPAAPGAGCRGDPGAAAPAASLAARLPSPPALPRCPAPSGGAARRPRRRPPEGRGRIGRVWWSVPSSRGHQALRPRCPRRRSGEGAASPGATVASPERR